MQIFLLVHKFQIRKFLMINLQMANPQIWRENISASDPDLHWFASNIIFSPSLVYFRLENAIKLCPKIVLKAKSRP
jgi:hypothetical protein